MAYKSAKRHKMQILTILIYEIISTLYYFIVSVD